MPDSFGTRLRLQRERQQIALATIAEQTKIKQSLLEELEHDNASHWPTSIFRRASREMPSLTEEFVIPPGKQSPPVPILNQQIDIE